MSFANPWLLLLFIPLALALWRAWSKPAPGILMPSAIPFMAVRSRGWLFKRALPFALYALAGATVVLALARPREGLEEIRRRAEGIDIMLAIDLSGSMSAYDVPPEIDTEKEFENAVVGGLLKPRLEIAKKEIKKFVESRPNDRIGLIGFAPLPYAACPPTLDHGWLLANLSRLEPGVIGDSTGIAGPIASATQRLKGSDSKRRIVVLFTDGSNNVNAKVTPRQAAKLANSFDVAIYTVGIGTSRAFVLQDSFFGRRLVQLQDEFDEALLKDLASLTGGRYYHAADAKGMADAMKEIDRLEKTAVEQPVVVNWREWGPELCMLAMLLLVLGFALESSVLIRIP